MLKVRELVVGAVVAVLSFAVADVCGPVGWAGYWLVVVAVLSRLATRVS